MAHKEEYVMLDPDSLEPVESGGQRFKKITTDGGSVALEAVNDTYNEQDGTWTPAPEPVITAAPAEDPATTISDLKQQLAETNANVEALLEMVRSLVAKQ